MASMMKFVGSDIPKLLKHDDRRILHDRNEDIDPSRTAQNYDLTPTRQDSTGHRMTKMEYYAQRKAEVYCYDRADVKTVAGCIVTLPREIVEQEDQRRFFETVKDFLVSRYGENNILSVTVHYDEGKTLYAKDGDGNLVRDEGGAAIREFRLGQPHLHCLFLPVTKIDHAALLRKKNHVKAMERYDEKISAAEVLNKRELQRLHPDLQSYLNAAGINCNVNSGITREQGGNRLVAEYKRSMDNPYIQAVLRDSAAMKIEIARLQGENDTLKSRIMSLERSITVNRDHSSWGDVTTWGEEKVW